jgi:hypothetical protein
MYRLANSMARAAISLLAILSARPIPAATFENTNDAPLAPAEAARHVRLPAGFQAS